MRKEGSNKIINHVTPGSGVLMIGCGHISPKVPNGLFHQKSSSSLIGIEQTN